MLRLSHRQKVFRNPFNVSVWVKINHSEVNVMQDHSLFEFAKLFEMLDSLLMIGLRLHPRVFCPIQLLASKFIPQIHINSSRNLPSRSVPVMSMQPIGLAQPFLNFSSKCPLFLDNAQLKELGFILSCLQAFFLSQIRTSSSMNTKYMKNLSFEVELYSRYIDIIHPRYMNDIQKLQKVYLYSGAAFCI